MHVARDKHDLPCWTCGGESSCSLFMQPKPHLHCFKCGEQTWKEEIVEEYMTESNTLRKMIDPNTPVKGNNVKFDASGVAFPQKGVCTAIPDRKILASTCEKYEVEALFTPDEELVGYAYRGHNANGEFVAQKVKSANKRMKWIGEANKVEQLFGQKNFAAGGRFITITEGEEDALAVYQMLKEHYPQFEPVVLSVNNGVGGAIKDLQRSWEFINSFQNIILCFDGDDAGQKAAAMGARLFSQKVKVVKFLEYRLEEEHHEDGTKTKKHFWKDACDYLNADRQKDFMRLWFDAEKYKPKGVIDFKDLWGDMTRKDTNICVPYPWEGLNKKVHGIRTGQLVVIKAPPKIGKTQVLREIVYHIRSTTDYPTGLLFIEDTKKSIGLGMCALHMNKPIQFPDIPYSLEELSEAHEYLSEANKIVVFDPEDERTVENIKAKIEFFVKAYDCKFIVLDHVSMLAYQSGDGDERRFLDKLFADLKEMTTKFNIAILAVTHVNDDGKTRGSRASVQLCDVLMSLSRDKLNPDPIISNTTDIVVEENRVTGDSGLGAKVMFDRDTGRMYELDTSLELETTSRDVKFDT